MAAWIRSYDRRWLKSDLIAGLAVALIVPKNGVLDRIGDERIHPTIFGAVQWLISAVADAGDRTTD